ncbi:MAG TPA: hypothetical protein PKX94_09890 [Opitutales bacterium]|nr:hypothetical protein [Opitutales bacterium]HOO93771.1 hypothetical protein [Opitutales bacterium]
MTDKPNDRIVANGDDLINQPNPLIWFTIDSKKILKPAPMTYFAEDDPSPGHFTAAAQGTGDDSSPEPESYCLCNAVCTCNPLSGGWNSSSGEGSRRQCSCVPVRY